MKKPLSPRTIAACFGIAVAILSWISLVSYWSTRQLVRSFDAVSQGSQMLDTLQYIQILLEAAESSARGYVITRRGLDAYRYAHLVVPYKLRQLGTLDTLQLRQKKQLTDLSALIDDHLSYLDRIVFLRQSAGYEAAVSVMTAEDLASRRSAMAHRLSEIEQEERAELAQRRGRAVEHSWETKMALVITSSASLLLLVWVFVMLRGEMVERRQAETATQRTETFMHSIIERIPYMILVKEAENLRLTLVNKAAEEWLGRTRSDLLHSNEYDLRPHEEAERAIEKDRDVLRQGVAADIPEESLGAGAARVLHTQKIPIPHENGEPGYLLTISEDITQRKQAERLLELSRDAAVESARMKSEFISNMSHEIRTPLAIVIGMNDLLLDTALTEEQKRFASTVKRSATGLLAISKTILDFSKIESGAFTLDPQDVNVRHVVEDVVAMMAEQAKAKGIGLVSLISNEIPSTVIGDGVRLRQVLTHLIGNAVKFTSRGEVVVRLVEARQSESHVWLNCRISDTGIGIDAQAQQHLFEPFRQADGSKTRRYGGTGLGLAVSKRVIELMGGEIGFESAAAQGSTFWFTLPFNKKQTQGPLVQAPSLPWTRARVLIIHENETYRQFLQQQLSAWSLASEVVSNGQTALDLLRREQNAGRPFAVVLFDMQLPDTDGVSLSRQIKRDAALASTQLLVMIDDDAPPDADACASLGIAGWVSRAAAPGALYERLAVLIEPTSSQPQHAA